MYKRIDKICLHCDNTYSGTKASKYCGYDCAKTSRKKRVTLNCQDCNKEFEVQEWNKDAKFCSYSCKVKNQSSNIVDITCNSCQTTFKRKEHKVGKHNFCSKSCANEFNKGVNHYEWKEHLHDKNIKLALKQWSLKIKERDSYTCVLCGIRQGWNKELKILTKLHADHIKRFSEYPELRFAIDNGRALCEKCHRTTETWGRK